MNFEGTGIYKQKVDYTNASTDEGKQVAKDTAVQKALEKAREAAKADILNRLNGVNEANLTIGAFFKKVLSEEECKKFFEELDMPGVYDILLEFSQVIDYMIIYQSGEISYNEDWYLLESN